jgi:hypothetical protein
VIYAAWDYSEYDLGDAIDEQAAYMGLKGTSHQICIDVTA